MDFKKDQKLFIRLTLLILPLMVITMEFISLGLKKYGKSIFPERSYIDYSHLTTDLINGIRFKEPENIPRNSKIEYIERRGLAKTFHTENFGNKNLDKGIIITGNSVSLGNPLIEKGKYKDTFVNLIEKNLRENENPIDLVNLSFYNFNSWEEKVALNRYIVSQNNHIDLPKVNLVASIGGIQDYWGFIETLHNKNKLNDKYFKAGGLMTWKNRNKYFDDFYRKSYKASQGNFLSGFGIFMDSLFTFCKENSNTIEILRRFRERKLNDSNLSYLEFEDFNKIKNYELILKKIIKNKIKITPEDYLNKRNHVISITERNIKSMAESVPNNNFLFIYLPNRITIKDQYNINGRYKYKNLNIRDLHIIEKDYRYALISKLSTLKNLKLINIGDEGYYDWFIDESHFSLKGHQEITKLLQPIFENSIDLTDDSSKKTRK
jgi:hypothetical protein